jgi:CYTH domain-containing protein
MSEITNGTTVAGIELRTDEQANPVVPTWLGEVLLLGEYWRTTV